MNSNELKIFIENKIPTFTDVKLLDGAGFAYHYTPHKDKIIKSGKFLGAPIDINLDKTYEKIDPEPAKHDPGVVFGYPNLEITKKLGKYGKCDFFEIEYKSAVSAIHDHERKLGEIAGIETPPTICILTNDIIGFRIIS